MRIAVINPNTTASMTARIGAAARAKARPGTVIVECHPDSGPDAIEGPFDGAMSVPGLLKRITMLADSVDAHVIACFDDTGLDAARSMATQPVVGIGEAAYVVASLISHSFCVVTTLPRSVPIIEDNLRRYGFEHRCRAVFSLGIRVLELEHPNTGAVSQISDCIEQGRKLGAEAVVLGCAGMVEFAGELERVHGLPIIEGVAAAVGLAELLAHGRYSTSRSGVWAAPTRRAVLGQS